MKETVEGSDWEQSSGIIQNQHSWWFPSPSSCRKSKLGGFSKTHLSEQIQTRQSIPKGGRGKKKKLKSGSAQEALERSFRASFEEPARANLWNTVVAPERTEVAKTPDHDNQLPVWRISKAHDSEIIIATTHRDPDHDRGVPMRCPSVIDRRIDRWWAQKTGQGRRIFFWKTLIVETLITNHLFGGRRRNLDPFSDSCRK